MSENLVYHSVKPSNDLQGSAGFTEYNTIDFNLVADGRKLVPNTIRVCGQLLVEKAGTAVTTTQDIKLDHTIGAHGFFESWQCETEQQVLENLQNYPRYCAMEAAVHTQDGDYCSGEYQAELRGPLPYNGKINCERVAPNAVSAVAAARLAASPVESTFAIKPRVCFNRQQGGMYSFSKKGAIKISCNLARNGHALSGGDTVAGTATYQLKNVRLTFQSVPDDGKQDKILMDSYVSIKSSMVSSQAHISARVPSKAVKGVSISFLRQAQEGSLLENVYALEPLPQLAEVEYGFRDTLNNFITYPIKDLGEALERGITSMEHGRPHNNSCNPSMRKANKGYILGTDFDGQFVDLSGQKFGLQLKSNFSGIASDTRLVFMYFHAQLLL